MELNRRVEGFSIKDLTISKNKLRNWCQKSIYVHKSYVFQTDTAKIQKAAPLMAGGWQPPTTACACLTALKRGRRTAFWKQANTVSEFWREHVSQEQTCLTWPRLKNFYNYGEWLSLVNAAFLHCTIKILKGNCEAMANSKIVRSMNNSVGLPVSQEGMTGHRQLSCLQDKHLSWFHPLS